MITSTEARNEANNSETTFLNIIKDLEKEILLKAKKGKFCVSVTIHEQTEKVLNNVILKLKSNGFKVILYLGFFEKTGKDTLIIEW
jgi:CTP-dependent riboflavin kinase